MSTLQEQVLSLAYQLDAPKKVPGKNIAAILRALVVAYPAPAEKQEKPVHGETQSASIQGD